MRTSELAMPDAMSISFCKREEIPVFKRAGLYRIKGLPAGTSLYRPLGTGSAENLIPFCSRSLISDEIYFTSAAVSVRPLLIPCVRTRVISSRRFLIPASSISAAYSAAPLASSSVWSSIAFLARIMLTAKKAVISIKVSRLPESTSNKTFRLISSFKVTPPPVSLHTAHWDSRPLLNIALRFPVLKFLHNTSIILLYYIIIS